MVQDKIIKNSATSFLFKKENPFSNKIQILLNNVRIQIFRQF